MARTTRCATRAGPGCRTPRRAETPPRPPQTPYGLTVSFDFALAGEVSDFDEAAFIVNLANLTHVDPSKISGEIKAASVLVTATVIADDDDAADPHRGARGAGSGDLRMISRDLP